MNLLTPISLWCRSRVRGRRRRNRARHRRHAPPAVVGESDLKPTPAVDFTEAELVRIAFILVGTRDEALLCATAFRPVLDTFARWQIIGPQEAPAQQTAGYRLQNPDLVVGERTVHRIRVGLRGVGELEAVVDLLEDALRSTVFRPAGEVRYAVVHDRREQAEVLEEFPDLA
ncbi:hypothetical protein OPAG_06777 [Rhodococcus opacus PD630]|nr:hypothetical protein Pd630_LPD15038 [Rhodococcus opacus PD630]EHI43498.1 hypothetical protein OPAG_06777 [Rhodococcus opacus PD630]